MSFKFLMVAGICAALVTSCATKPQTVALTPQSTNFVNRPQQRQAVTYMVDMQWVRFFGSKCAEMKPIAWQITYAEPIQFDSGGGAIAGAWKESITVEGCGNNKTFNIASSIGADKKTNMIGMFPGTSRADPQLEVDGLFHARFIALHFLPKGCTQINVVDTAFIAEEGKPAAATLPGRDPQPWREEWTFKGCDATAFVTIHFAPDATGTGILVYSNEARLG